jgi:hypothetical protein
VMVLCDVRGVASESQGIRLSSQTNRTCTASDGNVPVSRLQELSVGDRLSRLRMFPEQTASIVKASPSYLSHVSAVSNVPYVSMSYNRCNIRPPTRV